MFVNFQVDVVEDCSEIVVQYEAKSQDHVIFMSNFDSVDADYDLSVPQCELYFLCLVCHVHNLSSKSQLGVAIDH